MVGNLPRQPSIWADGSRNDDIDALVGVAGAGAFARLITWIFDARLGVLRNIATFLWMLVRICMSVPGLLKTVQWTEYWAGWAVTSLPLY